MNKKSESSGFTLIELLLYASLVGIVMLSASVFVSLILRTRVRNQVIAEVEQQGERAMQVILQTARNATGVNLPAIGATGSTLSLVMSTPGLNPSVFDLSAGVLRVTEDATPAVALTSARVVVSDLSIVNLGTNNPAGSAMPSVRVTFTVTYNAAGASEYTFSKTFRGTGSIR